MLGYGGVVCVYGVCGLGADVVEVDAADGDVGGGVSGPFGIDIHLCVDGCNVATCVVGFHIADCADVGVAVQRCDAADYIGVCGVVGGSGAGIGVYDDCELDGWVG